MSITPLSHIYSSLESPKKQLTNQDSLIFSIISQKSPLVAYETNLLESSKQLCSFGKDYFLIHDKIMKLEQKVQNIQTQYVQDHFKVKQNDEKSFLYLEKENQINSMNWEFPLDILTTHNHLEVHVPYQDQSIGKIKRKQKTQYYVSTFSKPKSNSNKHLNISKHTTKINDFSAYTNTSSKNQIGLQSARSSKKSKRSISKQIQIPKSLINKQVEILRKQLIQTKLSHQKQSRKSLISQKNNSLSKMQVKKLKSQKSKMTEQINQLRKQLKKSDLIKKKQKQTILSQKQQIKQLKCFVEQILIKNYQHDQRETHNTIR